MIYIARAGNYDPSLSILEDLSTYVGRYAKVVPFQFLKCLIPTLCTYLVPALGTYLFYPNFTTCHCFSDDGIETVHLKRLTEYSLEKLFPKIGERTTFMAHIDTICQVFFYKSKHFFNVYLIGNHNDDMTMIFMSLVYLN